MSEAVKLMMILQIGEDLVLSIDDVISIQIAVLLLGCAYKVNGAVRNFLKLRIRMLGQRIPHCLDPLGKITVLEYKAVKLIIQMLWILRQRLKAAEGVLRLLVCAS